MAEFIAAVAAAKVQETRVFAVFPFFRSERCPLPGIAAGPGSCGMRAFTSPKRPPTLRVDDAVETAGGFSFARFSSRHRSRGTSAVVVS